MPTPAYKENLPERLVVIATPAAHCPDDLLYVFKAPHGGSLFISLSSNSILMLPVEFVINIILEDGLVTLNHWELLSIVMLYLFADP